MNEAELGFELKNALARIEQLEAALRHIAREGDHVSRATICNTAEQAIRNSPSKDWCLNMARLEGEAGDPEIAAGEAAADPALFNLCEDEGCPNAGTPHVCINRVRQENDDVYPGFRGNNEA